MRLNLAECAEALKLPVPEQAERIVTGAAIDSREAKPGDLFFCLPGERVDGHSYAGKAAQAGCLAVIAAHPLPYCKAPVMVVPDPALALGQLARLWRRKTSAKVLCLTGTAGKTTLKEALAAIMAQKGAVAATKGNHNNQLGLPLTILNTSGDEDFWILEVGISHAGDMDYLGDIAGPDLALVLNAGTGHVEGLGDKGVAWHKARLFKYLAPNGIALVNADYPLLAAAASELASHNVFFACAENKAVNLSYRLAAGGDNGEYTVLTPKGEIVLKTPFMGEYGGELITAAVAAADQLGATAQQMTAGMADIKLPGQRFRYLEAGQAHIFDDTYNANPLSMRRMLNAAHKFASDHNLPFFAMLGEMGELGKDSAACHQELGRQLADLTPHAVFWQGGHAADVRAGLQNHAPFFEVPTPESFLETWQGIGLENRGFVILFKGSRANRLENQLAAFAATLKKREEGNNVL